MRSPPPATFTTLRFVARGENPSSLGWGAVRRGRSSERRPVLMAKRFCSSEVFAGLGTSTSVPSQLMPAKPVETLSWTPSSTEVITTRAKTPSISRVRVRSERSLCDHSSIRPPVTTSHTRAARTLKVRRRRIAAGARSEVSAPAGTNVSASLIAQGLHRRLPAGLGRRIEREQETEDDGEQRGPHEAQGGERQRHADRLGDHPREGDADEKTGGAPQQGQEQRLGHERLEDL